MFARTERLLLRPGWGEDASALAALLADGAVARNLLHMPYPYGLSDAEAFLAMAETSALPHLLVFKRTRGAPRLIGGCGISPFPEGGEGAVEIGYWIARHYWGLGFATEAARAMVSLAKASGHDALHGRHFVDNPASGRVLRKIGFRPTGLVGDAYSRGRGAHVAAVHLVHDEAASAADMGTDMPADLVYRDAA